MPQGRSVDPDVVAELVRRTTSQQGLPEHLEDPATIARIAFLAAPKPDKKKLRKRATNSDIAKEILRGRDL